MSKKVIWAVIGLMAISLFGTVLLQVDLIRTSIAVNEERFERNVFTALGDVAEALRVRERKDEISLMANGYALRRYFQNPGTPFADNQQAGEVLRGLNDPNQGREDYLSQNLFNILPFSSAFIRRPLEERIDVRFLDRIIQEEFRNRGIDLSSSKYQYHYGVYSFERESFVIVDAHYVVEDSQPRDLHPGQQRQNLYTTDYVTSLFPLDTPVPGELRIFFPNRSDIVWSSLGANLLGTLAFASVILFCFLYTVNVIFYQKKVSEMKTDFINNMTHEFKTPIATISLATDSITSDKISSDPSKVQRFAGIIRQENKRMHSQVEKVLQMALLDKKDFSLKLSPVNVHEVIERAVENIGLQVEQKDGVVHTKLEAEEPVILADRIHIANIINNLLDNANKYSPEKPEITVSTRNLPNGLEISIADNGIGMSREDRKNIFDKFFRVHTGNLHDVKGFGLGLSYVKAMVDAHNGSVNVRSELDKGSNFILFFPFQVNK